MLLPGPGALADSSRQPLFGPSTDSIVTGTVTADIQRYCVWRQAGQYVYLSYPQKGTTSQAGTEPVDVLKTQQLACFPDTADPDYDRLTMTDYFYDNNSENTGNGIGLGHYILDWSSAEGLSWGEDQTFSNVSIQLVSTTTFTDEDGNTDNSELGIQVAEDSCSCYNDWGQVTLDISQTGSVTTATAVETLSDTGSYADGRTADALDNEVLMLTTVYDISGDYDGAVTITQHEEYIVTFTADDQVYEITVVLGDDKSVEYDSVVHLSSAQSFDAENHPDADLKASVNGGAEDTEHDAVTQVARGDEITYRVETELNSEVESLYNLDIWHRDVTSSFLAMDSAFGEVSNLPYGSAIPIPSINGTMLLQSCGQVITLQLPDGLDYDESRLSEITLDQGSQTTWSLYDSSGSNGPSYDADTRTITIPLYIDIALPQPTSDNSATLFNYLDAMDGQSLSVTVPGVTVSEDAETATYYTAKAAISGTLGYRLESFTGIGPLLSPSRRSADSGVTSPHGYRLADLVPTTGDPLELDMSTIANDSGRVYSWEHLQNTTGQDYIQTASLSDELWYTVVIPDGTTSTTEPGEPGSVTKNPVETDDPTNIAVPILAMAAAAGLLTALARGKRSRG